MWGKITAMILFVGAIILGNWKPTPSGINSLPKCIRNYVRDLETMCDRAGIIAENTLLRDEIMYLVKDRNEVNVSGS